MAKRLFAIGILNLCLIGLVAAHVDAGCTVTYGRLKCNSVCPDAGGVGAGNVDKNPVALCSSLAVTQVDAYQCWNPAWNSATASGDPFGILYSPAVDGVVQLTKINLIGDRGQWAVTAEEFEDAGLCWTWEEIWGGITAKLCPNPEWHLVRSDDGKWTCNTEGIPDSVTALFDVCQPLVETMYAYFATYQQKKGEWVRAGTYCAECKFDASAEACAQAGNPITCTQVNTSLCAARSLVIQCDNAVH
jgi:hypothetical protein